MKTGPCITTNLPRLLDLDLVLCLDHDLDLDLDLDLDFSSHGEGNRASLINDVQQSIHMLEQQADCTSSSLIVSTNEYLVKLHCMQKSKNSQLAMYA